MSGEFFENYLDSMYQVEVTVKKDGKQLDSLFLDDEDHTWAMIRLEKWAHESRDKDL